jgi:hypothetical protein
MFAFLFQYLSFCDGMVMNKNIIHMTNSVYFDNGSFTVYVHVFSITAKNFTGFDSIYE